MLVMHRRPPDPTWSQRRAKRVAGAAGRRPPSRSHLLHDPLGREWSEGGELRVPHENWRAHHAQPAQAGPGPASELNPKPASETRRPRAPSPEAPPRCLPFEERGIAVEDILMGKLDTPYHLLLRPTSSESPC